MSKEPKVLKLVSSQKYVFTKSDRAWFMISGILGVALIYSAIMHIGDAWTISRMREHIEKLEAKGCR